MTKYILAHVLANSQEVSNLISNVNINVVSALYRYLSMTYSSAATIIILCWQRVLLYLQSLHTLKTQHQ